MSDHANENQPEISITTKLQFELVFGAMSLALGALANQHPGWLRTISLPAWYPRYPELQVSIAIPQTPQQRQSSMYTLQRDIQYLLDMIEKTGDESLKSLPEVLTLQKIREQWPVHLKYGQEQAAKELERGKR